MGIDKEGSLHADAHPCAALPVILEQAVAEAASQVGEKPVSVVGAFPAHLPVVEADPDQLHQAVRCLAVCMVNLASQGEVSVRAELLPAGEKPVPGVVLEGAPKVLAEGGPWAIVWVACTSVDPDEARVAQALGGGTGPADDQMPLARDCTRLVEDSRAVFWVDRPPEGGLRFGLALPLRGARQRSADLSSLRRAVESYLPSQQHDAHLLLLMVEGERQVAEELADALQAEGYSVLLTDSEDILSVARDRQPSMILLDLLAREPSALDIAMVLKQDRRTRNIPLLFITSSLGPEGVTQVGAFDFLVRPQGTGALVNAIRAALRSGLQPLARVLVVEPDDATRESMILMIQAHGYRVTEARSPEEALALAEHAQPDLALVNVRLAQERDYWLLRNLRQLAAEMGIFVLADALSEREGQAAVRRGASGYGETGELPDILDRAKRNHEEER